MRLQTFGVVFALICLPIILVLAYYIGLQVDTIRLQNQYNAKLLSATYDTMSAFELNTANEDLSTVSDSLRTIMEACGNIFINTLATNLGMSNASKSYIEPYIPAMLYTLYDGYYIYAPTYAPTVLTDRDGNAVSVGDIGVKKDGGVYKYELSEEYLKNLEALKNGDMSVKDEIELYEKNNRLKLEQVIDKTDYGQLLYETEKEGEYTTSIETKDAKYKTQHILKTYMPYSARYIQDNLVDIDGNSFDANINVIYTLDNYITIEGNFDYTGKNGITGSDRKIYYTKSGYLLPFTTVIPDGQKTPTSTQLAANVYLGDNDKDKVFKYNQNEIQQYIESGNPIKVEVVKEFGGTEYETIIDITDANKVVIDKSNTNLDSDTSKLNRYENLLFDLEELQVKASMGAGADSTEDLGTLVKNIYNLRVPVLGEVDTYKYTTAGDYIRNSYEILGWDVATIPESIEAVELYNLISRIIYGDETNPECLKSKINETKYNMQLNSAAIYYAKAVIFSKWVADNLYGLKTESIKDISGLNYTTYLDSFGRGEDARIVSNIVGDENRYVFQFSDGHDIEGATEIRKDSSYYTHKLAVITASIQYNLNLSMSAYNRHIYYNEDIGYRFDKNTDYAMPIMQQNEWEQILSNISIVSFMQGMDCGLKKYNNYVVVSSSNNEVMTTNENVFYTKKENFNDENSKYHRYDCINMINEEIANPGDEYEYMAIPSKDVKYDKQSTTSAYIPYLYDHKNLACYDCINDGNYDYINIFKNTEGEEVDIANRLGLNVTTLDTVAKPHLRKMYYIGIAAARNDVYKMNAVDKSEGFEVLYFNDNAGPSGNSGIGGTQAKNALSILPMNKIKSIELVLGALDVSRRDETSETFTIVYGGGGEPLKKQPGTDTSMLYSIPTNTTNKYTWNVLVDPLITTGATSPFKLDSMRFINQNPTSVLYEVDASDGGNEKLKHTIREIRIIYK